MSPKTAITGRIHDRLCPGRAHGCARSIARISGRFASQFGGADRPQSGLLACWCITVLLVLISTVTRDAFAALPQGVEPLEQRITITDTAPHFPLDRVLQTLEESEPLPNLMQSDKWASGPRYAWPSVGQETTMWYRFGLTSESDHPQMIVLEMPNRWIQSAHVFVLDHGRQQFRAVIGEPTGDTGSIAIGKLVSPIVVEPGAVLDVYLRTEGIPLARGSLQLLSERRFMRKELSFSLESGLIFGVLVALVVLASVVYRILRARNFLGLSVYGLVISAHLLIEVSHNPLAWWFRSLSSHQYLSVLFSLLPICGLGWWISRRFNPPYASRFLKGVLIGALLTMGIGLVVPTTVYYSVIPLYAPLLCLAAFGGMWWCAQVPWSTLNGRYFGLALLWLGGGSLAQLLLVSSWLSQAVLLHSLAWLGHLCLLLLSVFFQHRGESLNRYKQRLRSLEETHQKDKLEHELVYHTMYDSLTGCPNRVAILHRLDKAITEDPDKQVYVCLIYLDRFKEINNTLGHHNGDELLKRVARRLSRLATQLPGILNLDLKSDKVSPLAAIDGVVFGLLLSDLKPDLLQSTGEQILRSLSYPFEFKKMTLDISAYIGIAGYPAHGKGASELLQHAYVAVELAQQQDDGLLYYTHELDPYSARRLTLVGELKHALRSNELEVYYQPQLDIKQDLVIGVEALVRWFHPEHGFISPAEFIPVAEKTGVIKHLTAWVMERAIQDAASWYDQGILLRVSVNLSAKNLQESDLPTQITELLHKHHLPTEAIALEITETAMMVDPARALKIITQLHDHGIRLCVDDFGTGYSSLAYLKQLPVAEIKIDRSFVGEMCRNTDDQVIVNTTLNMSHNLGLEVVAEGVEDERTLVSLKRLGCDLAQGYFIAKPMSLPDVERWLLTSPHNVIRIDDEDEGSERAAG